MSFELTSPAFDEGGTIPSRFTCDGDDVSPALAWAAPPDGTEGFAVIMDDPDAPAGTWVHWVVYDLPPSLSSLEEDVPPRTILQGGGTHGENSWGRVGYGGPCPPDGTHTYVFKLYALDARLGLDPGADKARLLDAMEGHVLAEARLTADYARG